MPGCISMGFVQFLGPGFLLQAAQRGGLRLAAALRQRLGKVGEQHREPQPQRHRQDETGRSFAVPSQRLKPQNGGQDAAHVDHEHDRISPLNVGRELFKRFNHCRLDQHRIEQSKGFT
ncbi:hypothetical protein GALL_430360 [mine drainage metagenome]|uniref:Uncharacterized protein n=1 Tax=mine drainage metagenome TaxID=410659 RepID=A0A1J5PUK4_9ZZZZ